MAFTDIGIRNLEPGSERREIPDPGSRGLYLVLQPSGKRSFAVRYRSPIDGRPRKLTFAGNITLAAARKLASDALYEVEQGRDPADTKKESREKTKVAKAQTVQWLCENYLKREGGKLRTVEDRKKTLERLVYPDIGDVPLSSLKRSHVVDLLDDIEDNSGPRMADVTLAYLRKALKWHAGRTDDFNSPIVSGMGRYDAKANEGTRTLADDEIRKIWKASEPTNGIYKPIHALVRFALLTACRRDEARKLARGEIKGTNWILPKARNKVKFDLERPLSKSAQAVLAGLPSVDGPYVFTTTEGKAAFSTGKPLRQFREDCGVTDWSLHDLRRTSKTLMARAGVPDHHSERCLGHVIPGVRGVYDRHKYHAEMQTAYETLAAEVGRIINPPANNVRAFRRKAR